MESERRDRSRWAEEKRAEGEREACRRVGRIKIATEKLRQKAAWSSPFQIAESLTSVGRVRRELELAWTSGSLYFCFSAWGAHGQNWHGSPSWEVLLNKGLKGFAPGMSRCCTWELLVDKDKN